MRQGQVHLWMQRARRIVGVACVYVIFAQALLGAVQNTAHALPQQPDGAFAVLCAPGGTQPPVDVPVRRTADCPCGTLCSVAAVVLPAPQPVLSAIPSLLEREPRPSRHAEQAPPYPDIGREPFIPRGPPANRA